MGGIEEGRGGEGTRLWDVISSLDYEGVCINILYENGIKNTWPLLVRDHSSSCLYHVLF